MVQMTTDGVDKLSRVFVAIQQTVPILVDGIGSALVSPHRRSNPRSHEAAVIPWADSI
jgi:hypothetical protein